METTLPSRLAVQESLEGDMMHDQIEITPKLLKQLEPFQKEHEWEDGDRIIFLGKHIFYVTGKSQLWTGIGSKRWLETTDEINDVTYYPTEGDLCRMLRSREGMFFFCAAVEGLWEIRVNLPGWGDKKFRHENYYVALLHAVRWAVYKIEEE